MIVFLFFFVLLSMLEVEGGWGFGQGEVHSLMGFLKKDSINFYCLFNLFKSCNCVCVDLVFDLSVAGKCL